MKKITLSLLSFFMVFMLFGQKLIQNPNLQSPQSQTLTTAPINFEQISQQLLNNAQRTPDGLVRCFSTEYEQLQRMQNPQMESIEDFEAWLAPKVAAYKAGLSNGNTNKAVITVPVIMHIIHNSTESVGQGRNISQAQATSQITILNEDFRRLNADAVNTPAAFLPVAADLEINFVPALRYASNHPLAGQTLAEPGINRVSTADIAGINNTTTGYSTAAIDATIKPATYWDRTEVMNVWVCQIQGGILGYAQFPSSSGLGGLNANGGSANTDGLVLGYTYTGTGGVTTAPFNKGRTATHEIGHWAGLRHIWGDGACGTDDFVADTPESDAANYGCTQTHVSCGTTDMVQNYMDYSDDACMNLFTEGQKARVTQVFANSPGRSELPTSTLGSTLVTTAQFVGTPTTVNVGGSVTFTDQSQSPDNITSWNWSFPGGTPSSFVGQTPPAISYAAAGQYNVSLVITDDNAGGDTETKTNYINVVNAAACDTLLNIDLASDNLAIYGDGGIGYATGYNSFSFTSVAEQYSSYNPYSYVTGFYGYFYDAVDDGNGASVDFNVWNDNGNEPGTIVGTLNVPLSDIASALAGTGTPLQGLVEFMFDEAINVGSGPFYIGMTFNGFSGNDALGVVSNSVDDATPNSTYSEYNGVWYANNALFAAPAEYSIFLSPYVSLDAPTATISTNTTTICSGETVDFDASSSVNTTGYNWVFNGGSPTSATTATETVTYAAAGTPRAYLIVDGNCGSIAIDSVDITVNTSVTPTFTQVGPYCVGDTPATLPTTSNNGVSGTWNAAISTASAGTVTYTFTPSGGCATTATMDVVVSSSVTPTFTQVGPYCVGDTPATLPTTSNNGVSGTWNAAISTASAGTVTYTFTPSGGGCATTATMDVVVSANVTPTFTQVGPYCVGDTPATLPTTSNNGVSGTWNAAISTASAGTVTYTFTPSGGCATTATMDVVVNAPTVPTFTQVGPYCVGDTPATLPTTSNNGVSGSWNASVSTASAGTITYTFTPSGGCTTTATMDVVVNAPTVPTFTQMGPYCIGATAGTLPTTSNNGVSGTWNATISTASAGTVTYTFTPSGGCATTATMDVVVSSSVTPTFTQVGPYCVGDIPATLPTTSNNSISGTWNAAISTTNAGTVTYTFTPSGGGCATSTTMDVVVNTSVTPTFTQVGPYCVGDTPATLPTTSNNGVSGTWNAVISTASAGTVTYTFTPSGGCATSTTMDVVVNAPTVPTFTQVGPYCVGDTPATLPTTSNNGVSGTWNAAISTASAGTVTYTFTPSAGCATTATMDVVVSSSVTPTFTQVGPYCVGDTPATLPTTSNNGVSGSWNTAISTAIAGTVTYTFTPSGSGCATSTTMDVVVSSSVTPTFTQVGPYCVGDTPATLPTTSNNGVSGSWNAAISTAIAGTVTYTFTPSGSGCELPTTMDVVVNTCVGINEINTATVLIYPNPASETLIIETANLEVDQVRLINILGETLVSDRVNNSIIKMNVSEFSMGVYFVQLVDTKGQVMRTEKVSIR
jgi:PKD repeat protein